MLVEINDIVRIEGKSEIVEIGGKIVEAGSEIAMHKDTGIVFIKQSYRDSGKLYCFTVGKLDHTGEITEKREYHEKTEKDFFDAVKYFEELIRKQQPEEDNQSAPPSMGKFFYFKGKLNKRCYVEYDGIDGKIEIDQYDVDKAFTPPKSKPYGRLDMTVATDLEPYESIRSKFALKYNLTASEQVATTQRIDLSDCAVYDMTPYSNDSQDQNGQPDSTPEEVNDDQLTPDQIEGEDLNDQKNKDDQKKERQDKKKQDQQKQESSEKSDEKSDSSQDQNEPQKGDGDQQDDKSKQDKSDSSQSKQDSKKSQSDSSQQDASKTDDQPDNKPSDQAEKNAEGDQLEQTDEESTDQNDQTVEGAGEDEGDQESEDVNEKSKIKHTKGDGEVVEREIPDYLSELSSKVSSQDLVSALSKMYNTNDLKDAFRRQRNFLMALDSMSENELKQNIYKKLGLPKELPKQDFISLVESKTKNLFQ